MAKRLDFVTYDGPQWSTLDAHVVTEDTAGERVALVGGDTGHKLSVGEVVVRSNNANMYDVYPQDAWDGMGYTAQREQRDYEAGTEGTSDVDATDDPDYFEPSDHTAAEVRAYLSRSDVDDENKARVEEAEVSTRNRSTAFPKDYVRQYN